jgi:SynChlorMet cassette protein ScmC
MLYRVLLVFCYPLFRLMNQTLSKFPPVEYGLTLSDGSSWCLSGVNGQSAWVDRLAAIMELKAAGLNGSPKLIFSSTAAAHHTKNSGTSCVAARLNLWGRSTRWRIDDPASVNVWSTESIPDVLCEMTHPVRLEEIQYLNMWYTLLPIYQRSVSLGGLPFHGGLVELDGRGVLLAASSDKGKSTCCGRFPEYWQPLCDDETLVVLDTQKQYRAHPFPTWSEYILKRSKKTWNVQDSVPLAAIFFIEQSETDEIEPLGEGQTAVLITESAAQIYEKFLKHADKKDQRQFREVFFNNACRMAKQIPSYRLHVSLNGRFWEKMEEALEW